MIYAYKEPSDAGNYVDADEVRWTVHFAARLHGNVRDCWKAYDSKAAALEFFGLIPYIDESESYEYQRE